jgi:hypothetical protein
VVRPQIAETHWAAIQCVATLLLDRESLTGDEVAAIVKGQ